MSVPAPAKTELAPSGTLRVAMNYGNSVLARREPDGAAGGITADIGRELGRRLGVPVTFVHYEQAGDVFAGLGANAWDVCFLANEPVRAAKIAFSEPYILIEGAYLVPPSSHLRSAAEVDRAGTRIGVIVGSAYDLFLTRELKEATLVREPSAAAVIGLLASGAVDLIGGVKPQVQADSAKVPGSRLLPEAFMSIRQSMGTSRERAAAAAYLADYIRDLKKSGFMAEAFARNRIEGASLAP